MTSTYVGSGTTPPGQPFYGRVDNATWVACEEAIGALEGVDVHGRTDGDEKGALLFASGMAAISAVLDQVPHGGLVVLPSAAYNTTLELVDELTARGRVSARPVDVADTDAVRAALSENPRGPRALLWLESPTNPLLDVADVAACVAVAHQAGALAAVDNTFATPLVQRPLDLGADVVVHSVTKYLAGHSDLVLGAAVTADPGVYAALSRHRRLHGAVPGPWEAWLALRGIRTLGVRMERAQASAAELARRLSAHPSVERVRHPSLPSDPGHERAAAQMRGFGAVVAVEVRGGPAIADAVVDAVRLWLPATSLGGVESMIERRRRHGNESTAVPEALLRLSVGIENVEDLWRDLDAALRSAAPQP
jgi:cystathionine gamma-synthase